MNLEKLLGSLDTKLLPCFPNRGNAGDGLIQAGLHQLCERLGITLKMIEYPQETTGKHVLLIGAGCFCPGSWQMVDPVRFYAARFENVYILPTTFDTAFGPVAKLLRELPVNVIAFCRERTSYDAARRMVPRPDNILLDHDLAFQVDVLPWKKTGWGELNCFRTDNESLLHRIPQPNFDVSRMGREFHHTLLLDTLANFELIHTDRLHVMIAGALLGKKVTAFAGNYHKNRSVYEYSLQEKFPNITFGDFREMRALLAAEKKKLIRHNLAGILMKLPRGEVLRRYYKKYRRSRKKERPLL